MEERSGMNEYEKFMAETELAGPRDALAATRSIISRAMAAKPTTALRPTFLAALPSLSSAHLLRQGTAASTHSLLGGELEFGTKKVEFAGDWQDAVAATLTVKNPTGKRMAFKIKCSDDDLFKIRPLMGILEEGKSSSVTLTFTPKDKGQAPADPHHFSLYQLEAKDADPNARKLWEDPDAKKLNRIKKAAVVFTKADKKDDDKKDDDKKEDKKDDDKKEDKKDDDKKEDKKDNDKKEDDKKDNCLP